jgi:hypothetical protein
MNAAVGSSECQLLTTVNRAFGSAQAHSPPVDVGADEAFDQGRS